jgi:hypothetical protein
MNKPDSVSKTKLIINWVMNIAPSSIDAIVLSVEMSGVLSSKMNLLSFITNMFLSAIYRPKYLDSLAEFTVRITKNLKEDLFFFKKHFIADTIHPHSSEELDQTTDSRFKLLPKCYKLQPSLPPRS